MSRTQSPKHSRRSSVSILTRVLGGDQGRAVFGPFSGSGRVVSGAAWRPVQSPVSAASSQAGRVPAFGCIVGTHAAEPSSPALRVASRVLTDQGLTAPHAGTGSRL